MGEILGIGKTHYLGLTATDEGMSSIWTEGVFRIRSSRST